jgi:hypothetical protein
MLPDTQIKFIGSMPPQEGKKSMLLNEITKNEAGNLRKAAQRSRTTSDEAVWEMCKALHRIYYSGYAIGDQLVAPIYELWGYSSWFEYIEEEVGIHVGQANMMVSVAHFFVVKMDGAWSGKNPLSLAKMKTIARAKTVTTRNLGEWLIKARNKTPCALDHELGGHSHGEKRQTSFVLNAKQHDILKGSLDSLMATGEFATRGDALLSVFTRRKASAA